MNLIKTSIFFSVTLMVLWCNGVKANDLWWEYGHFYQIYPRSFQDSNGDGIGDLNGITSRLTHFKDIGVDGVWLSPFYASPLKDFGYDISDFRSIHPDYGTMKDFERLVARCKELNIKLVIDYVPNHTSDEHPWFLASMDPKHPEHEKYKDYYVWNAGKLLKNGTRVPPSNWISIFRGSAWQWSDRRQSYYLHQCAIAQPDLNFRNPVVVHEMNEVIRFWLRKGVSGFRIDAAPMLVEAPENSEGLYDDEPKGPPIFTILSDGLTHINTIGRDESYDMICHFHEVLEEPEFAHLQAIFMTESYMLTENLVKFYGKVKNGKLTKTCSEVPFNFRLLEKTNGNSTAVDFKTNIVDWMNHMPRGPTVHANWVLGNHDSPRIFSKYGIKRTDLINILLKTLPGITITYYGEEIGMPQTDIPKQSLVDKQNVILMGTPFYRDTSRTPMQWDGSQNSGFSKAKRTWLPVSKDYKKINVEVQKTARRSYLKVNQQLAELRKLPTMKYGGLKIESINNNKILAYKRETKKRNDEIVAVVLNLGQSTETVDLNASLGGLPKQMKIIISSIHYENTDVVDTRKVIVPPNVGMVLIGNSNGAKCGLTCGIFESFTRK